MIGEMKGGWEGREVWKEGKQMRMGVKDKMTEKKMIWGGMESRIAEGRGGIKVEKIIA